MQYRSVTGSRSRVSDITLSLFPRLRSFAMLIRSVFTLCSLVKSQKKTEMAERNSLPFPTRAFSLTKNEKQPVSSGLRLYTDPILPLPRLNQTLPR